MTDDRAAHRLQSIEIDEASLAAHFDHPNYHNMRDMLGRYGLKSAVSRKLRIDKTAPVYGADFKASASFD